MRRSADWDSELCRILSSNDDASVKEPVRLRRSTILVRKQ